MKKRVKIKRIMKVKVSYVEINYFGVVGLPPIFRALVIRS